MPKRTTGFYFKRVGLIIAFTALGIVAIKFPIGFISPLIKANQAAMGPSKTFLAYIAMHSVTIVALMGILWVFTKKIDRTGLRQVGLGVDRRALEVFGLGALTTVIAGVLTVYCYHLLAGTRFEVVQSGWTSVIGILLLSTVAALLQTTYEELWMRSWSLSALTDLVGQPVAALVYGSIFGLLHFLNPSYSITAMLCAMIAGVMMCYAVFRAGSIWMAVGLHFGWNFITGGVLYSRFLFHVTTPDGVVVTGFTGAEGTIPGVVFTLMAAIFVFSLPWIFEESFGRSRPDAGPPPR